MTVSSCQGHKHAIFHSDNDIREAKEISWKRFGRRITVYLPGMFSYQGLRGKYPALSITGRACELQCEHCRATTLEPMISADSPERLIKKAMLLSDTGNHGILISGGCDREGKLPWGDFLSAIREIKDKTDLYVSAHCGILDYPTALRLKEAGIDQALIDVIGDDETYRRIYHVNFGISRIAHTMDSLERAGIPIVPHVVCGLYFGKMRGERRALELISGFDVSRLVIVSLMTIPGTPLWGAETPGAEEVADIIVEARLMMPGLEIGLGCARQRGDTRMETLAMDAGVNRMALPSEKALAHAMDLGLEIRYQRTCCSVSRDFSRDEW
jgi:uncharacterized radical SAM superfamily protein